MVELSEILIGNYFIINHNYKPQLCTVVKALEEPYFIVNTEQGNERVVVKPEELEPVPLTEAWVRKLKFQPGEILDHWVAEHDNIVSVLKHNRAENEWVLMHTTGVKTSTACRYVHTLQNDYYAVYKSRLRNGVHQTES